MDSLLKNKKTILIFILPALLFYLLIASVPILSTIGLSFFNWDVAGLGKWVGLKNYLQLFTVDQIFINSIKHTFLVTILCVLIQMPCAILLALLLRKKIAGKRFFKTVFFLPNVISSVAVGLLWMFILHPQFGIVNFTLKFLSLEGFSRAWLGDETTALICVVLAVCWQCIGYHMILYLCALEGISQSVMEAAEIDGANSWNLVRYIILPMLVPIINIDVVLITTGSFRIFDLVFAMTEGGPNHATEVIATHMYTRTFKGMQFGYGSSMAVVLMIICVFATVFLNSFFKKMDKT